MRYLKLLFMFILYPTLAHARGGGNQLEGIFVIGLILVGGHLVMYLYAAIFIGYSKMIAKIFRVPEHIHESDWWPWACFYGSVLSFLAFVVYLK